MFRSRQETLILKSLIHIKINELQIYRSDEQNIEINPFLKLIERLTITPYSDDIFKMVIRFFMVFLKIDSYKGKIVEVLI